MKYKNSYKAKDVWYWAWEKGTAKVFLVTILSDSGFDRKWQSRKGEKIYGKTLFFIFFFGLRVFDLLLLCSYMFSRLGARFVAERLNYCMSSSYLFWNHDGEKNFSWEREVYMSQLSTERQNNG